MEDEEESIQLAIEEVEGPEVSIEIEEEEDPEEVTEDEDEEEGLFDVLAKLLGGWW